TCAIPTQAPKLLASRIFADVVRQNEGEAGRCMTLVILGAKALKVGMAVPEHPATLPTKAPVALVVGIFVDVVRQNEGEAGRCMTLVILGAKALKVGIAVPEHPATLPAEAPASLVVGVFGEVMGQNKIEAYSLMVLTRRAEAFVVGVAVPK